MIPPRMEKAQLGVRLQGVDAVVHKQHPNPKCPKFPGKLDGVQNVPGKPAHFFGDDELEFAHFGIGNHAVELNPLLGAGAGNALVGVDFRDSQSG